MQKLQKTYELISSLLLNISHFYIKVQPEERTRYKNELYDGNPSNGGSIPAYDRTPSFLETVLTSHGVHANSYFILVSAGQSGRGVRLTTPFYQLQVKFTI